MSWGADSSARGVTQFWRSRGAARARVPATGTATATRAPPPPAWWFQNGGRGGTRMPTGPTMAGGVAPAPARPEPLKPDDDCEASCILEKRINGDVAQYLVEWKDSGKENSWMNRN